MATVTKYATTGQAAGGVFNGSWTNPTNVASDNSVYATAAPGKNQEYASVFPVAFSTGEVPSGATINSALVEVQVKCSTTASIGIVTSSLFADSGQATAIGAVPGVQSPATEPTVDTTYSFTCNPTETEIRDLWVRVQGTRGNSNTALTWSLDFVRVTVDYTVVVNTTATPGTASLATSAFAPTIGTTNNQTATVGVASLTTAAFVPTVTASANQAVVPATASLTSSTLAPTVTASSHQTVTPGTASVALSVLAPTVTASAGTNAIPGTAGLTLTAFAPTVAATAHQTVTPATAAMVTSAFAPSLQMTVTIGVASLTVTRLAPTVTALDPKTVTPPTATLSTATFAPSTTVSASRVAIPGPATLSLASFAAQVNATANRSAIPATASLSLSAFAPAAIAPQLVTLGMASLTSTAYPPAVVIALAVVAGGAAPSGSSSALLPPIVRVTSTAPSVSTLSVPVGAATSLKPE